MLATGLVNEFLDVDHAAVVIKYINGIDFAETFSRNFMPAILFVDISAKTFSKIKVFH